MPLMPTLRPEVAVIVSASSHHVSFLSLHLFAQRGRRVEPREVVGWQRLMFANISYNHLVVGQWMMFKSDCKTRVVALRG